MWPAPGPAKRLGRLRGPRSELDGARLVGEAPDTSQPGARRHRLRGRADAARDALECVVANLPLRHGPAIRRRALQRIAFIAEATVAKRILDHVGLDSTGPPLAPARGGQLDSVDAAPAYDVADPLYDG